MRDKRYTRRRGPAIGVAPSTEHVDPSFTIWLLKRLSEEERYGIMGHNHHACGSCGGVQAYYRQDCPACEEELALEFDEDED